MSDDADRSKPAQDPEPSLHDSRLAGVLAELVDRVRGGEQPAIEPYLDQHPDLADDLRGLWAAASMAEELAGSATANRATGARGPADLTSPFGDAVELAEAESLPRPFGDYELIEVLGRGGMGIVYKARQLSLDRLVALKMMLRGSLASAEDRERFRAEAEAAAGLDHPHIVPVYEVGEIDGQPYFSMKFVAGETLAQRVAGGPIDAREAASLLLPVARAIEYAHRRGVLHRDLKPSNILIDRRGQPHLTDFGLAKRIEAHASLTHSGAILGTPGYIAPEQAAGSRGDVGPAADIYGLGAILYQTLTGRPPFQASSAVDTLLLVLEQDPLPPRLLNGRADRDLEMISLRCLQKPPELRYPTAGHLADDLAAFLAGEPIAARTGGFRQVLARWFRETHHATVLENWGLLWMWHSLVLLVLCVTTNVLEASGFESPLPYLALWTIGLAVWAPTFWMLRRRAGPVTFVERQIAHVWAGSVVASILLFVIEMLLDLPVLTLSPVLGIVGATVFVSKAGILSGTFYFQAAALYATAIVMAVLPRTGLPDVGLALYGVVTAACFFLPGWKYYRQRRAVERRPP